MVRTYLFTATTLAIYNVWNDIIAPPDPTLSNSPYVEKVVKKFTVYFPLLGPNSASNAGNYVSIFVGGVEAKSLITGDTFSLSGVADTSRIGIQGSALNVQAELTIVF